MILMLLCIGFILALVNMIVFQGSIWMSIPAILILGLGIVSAVFRKRLPFPILRAIWLPFVCLVIGMLFLVYADSRTQKQGIRYYESQIQEVRDKLIDGKLDAAAKILESLEEQYGSDDTILLLNAIRCLEKENCEEAYRYTKQIKDRTSALYYAVMEQVYIMDSTENSVEMIYQMYIEAAQNWPDWTHMQKYAGIAQFEQGNYASAEYYLLRALEQDEADYRTHYYLGAVKFYQNNYDSSRLYFNEALKQGADNTTKENIVWYVQQMEQ